MRKARDLVEVLSGHVGMDPDNFPEEFRTFAANNKLDIDRRTPQNWIDNNSTLGAKSKDFIAFWHERIPEFTQRQLMLGEDELRNWLKQLKSPRPTYDRHKKVNNFAAAYQIIRPHTSDRDCYVLEAMEIERAETADYALFYSHNHPDPKYLYEGVAHVAERYLFALMARTHETHEGQSAYRSISFFVGDNVSPQCFSGIMTRGTSGDSAGKRAVSIPMIALRVSTSSHLRGAQFKALPQPSDAERLHQVKSGAALLMGEVREHWYPGLYDFCHRYFAKAAKAPDGLFAGNPMVLHSIVPATIKSTPGVGLERWKALVVELSGS
ncbi:MAG: hypothetical protein P4L64_00030 [Caulobacteraceae bacterium]|nr:hypothetical protein [Caulobacteraceae bacterium]